MGSPFDFIIAGGGAAGLSLACHLINSPLRDCSILIVDKDDDDQINRNWGFWTNQPTLFDATVSRAWRQLHVVGEGFERTFDLEDYQYKLIRGADFYRYALDTLRARGNADPVRVTFARGVVERVEDAAGANDEARVVVNGREYHGRWVFDSIMRAGALKRQSGPYRFLKMHFKGWEIETSDDVFNPNAATLFDFRTPAGRPSEVRAMRFFYVMPFTSRRALVEYVLFSPDVLRQDHYERALREHIESVRGIQDYQIVFEENGCVPITDYPFARRTGRRIMAIGAKGGQLKPSTGYSFMRVQQDSAAIVQSLLKCGHPFDVSHGARLFRLGDSVLLDIMLRRGDEIKPIFTAMFAKNPIHRVFRFLDETASPLDVMGMVASLPPWQFVYSLGRVGAQAARTRTARAQAMPAALM